MRLTIYGSGYVGLVTGACLAEVGNRVLCMEVDSDRVAALQRGEVPIYEPGLDALLEHNVAAGRLSFTTDVDRAVAHGELQIIAVGTPQGEDGSADIKHVLQVARSIGERIDGYRVVVTKSTVPVGTVDEVRAAILESMSARGLDHDFDVVSNPEFLKEGDAVEDFMKPDRIVIGADSDRARELMRRLYQPFNRNHDRLIEMDLRSAELTKYAANAMLATKISFMNELANIAERVCADIEQVRVGIGSDRRIGYHFIYAGAGYGGSCFPKDVRALGRKAAAEGYDARLLEAVEAVNQSQKRVLFEKLSRHFEGELSGRTIALWGLSFKPNTDDMREASSRVLMEALWEAGATVRAYDPEAMPEALRIYGERDDLVLSPSALEAAEGADALVVITEWKEFRSPDLAALRSAMASPVLFDGRNIYDPAELVSAGFRYSGIGRL